MSAPFGKIKHKKRMTANRRQMCCEKLIKAREVRKQALATAKEAKQTTPNQEEEQKQKPERQTKAVDRFQPQYFVKHNTAFVYHPRPKRSKPRLSYEQRIMKQILQPKRRRKTYAHTRREKLLLVDATAEEQEEDYILTTEEELQIHRQTALKRAMEDLDRKIRMTLETQPMPTAAGGEGLILCQDVISSERTYSDSRGPARIVDLEFPCTSQLTILHPPKKQNTSLDGETPGPSKQKKLSVKIVRERRKQKLESDPSTEIVVVDDEEPSPVRTAQIVISKRKERKPKKRQGSLKRNCESQFAMDCNSGPSDFNELGLGPSKLKKERQMWNLPEEPELETLQID